MTWERAAGRRPVWTAWALAGLLACAATLPLPWDEPDFRLPGAVRLVMAAAGTVLLLVVARVPRGRSRGVVGVTGALGVCVVAYPSLLALSAAHPDVAVLGGIAGGWHGTALTVVQLAPVLASTRVTGRAGGRWETAVVVVAGVSAGLTVPAVVGVGGSEVAAGVGYVLWLGSFLIAPVATWTAVAGTGGETRRRAVLAALASLFPVVVIVWCAVFGMLAAGIGAGDDLAATTLMIGFAAGTLLGGLAVAATAAPAGSRVLRTRVVVLALDGLLAVLVLVAGSVVALLLPDGVVAPGWALLAGAGAVAALVWPWLRLHAWAVRVVDPSAELRHELALAGDVADGQQRRAAELVLRRLVEDPQLTLHFRVEPGTWATADGSAGPEPVGAVALARSDGRATVVARVGGPDAAARLTSLGDGTPLLRPALLEACLVHEAGRAAAAAEQERRRIAADLHDGLQGRLLGLALNLQLSGRAVDDPSARILLDETVDTLRSAVEDVRALGGGRQPEILARDGLAPTLDSLFRDVRRPLVEMDVPAARFAPDVEATAYFVVAEAVANALKHADARRVDVRIGARGASVAVTVTDDGRGGADPRRGSGLRGLAERVAATGGVLVVRDGGTGCGTVVEAVVPCGS